MHFLPLRRLVVCVSIVGVALSGTGRAQQRTLTLDDIYDPQKRVIFSGRPANGFVWIDGAHYAWPKPGSIGVEWTKVDAATGAAEPLFNPDKMEAALAAVPGVARDEARRAARSRGLEFDAPYMQVLASIADDLYLYSVKEDRAVRLTTIDGDEEQPAFSPNGRTVAFVRHHNLFAVDIASRKETALTTDGTDRLLNGEFDWVYEEEIYGRGEKRAFWWSPDSTRVAFLRIDDTTVPSYLTIDDIQTQPTVETWYYPKAGDPNPLVKVGIASATGQPVAWVDTTGYPTDSLIVRVGWTPDSRRIVYEVQNRTQTWLDLNLWDAADNKFRTILHETSKYWIGSDDTTTPTWLKDGSFLWLSERTGWRHAFHYRPDGSLIRQVTDGKWELRSLLGVDESSGTVYFSGTANNVIGEDIYRIGLDGSGLKRLSGPDGTHNATFSPTQAFYFDSWSNATTPTQVRLYRSDGTTVRPIDENRVPALTEFRLSKPEFVHVPTRDGFLMEAMMIKPPDFDPSRRYPVYQFTYGGPHNPQVRDSWRGSEYMYHQLLAQKGIIVWICDNRTASGKGAESAWPLKNRMGESELRDIEDGIAWLKRQPYVDGSRIGIHGWSYGGYMTSYALTHSTTFVMGISGGTLSDWRNYDTVYTERFLGTPQENPSGYRDSSPRWSASNLHGALLLIHGAVDDNVHVANTMQFVYELQKAHKPFELMLYPKSRHGVTDPALVYHLRQTMLTFVLEHLKPEKDANPR